MQSTVGQSNFLEYLNLVGEGLEGLQQWELELKERLNGRNVSSCMVFNANPFTTGHRYLAEIAARRSKGLLVLVIQGRPESGGKGNHENTGIEFSFKDRMEMTTMALSDMNDVIVLPSGPYIISRDDFPKGYLSETMGAAPAHAALDSMVFCHVCRSLGISSAFAGDEPRDELSEIHLNALRQECAGNSIVLKVAERKRLGDRYISSSLVRQALEDKKMDEVRSLVPENIFEYLVSASYLKAPCS